MKLLGLFIINAALLFFLYIALEFIYAQAPENMKAMLTGLFYFNGGLFAAGVSAVFLMSTSSSHPSSFILYQLILLVFTGMGFVAYVTLACLYTNRQTHMTDSDLFREEHNRFTTA